MFWKILPESRHFRPTSLRPKTLFINFRLHWRDRGLPLLFAEGFLLMGSFVTLFNYIGYRLMLSPACQSGRGWLIIAGLFDRYMELTQSRNHDRPLWTRSGDVVFDGGYAVWFTDDLIQLAVADLCRNVTLLSRILRSPPLPAAGSAPRKNALRRGLLAVSVQLLSGVEYCRDAGWCFLA